MATITGVTKTTTPTRLWFGALAASGVTLALLSFINLFCTTTPLAALNDKIVADLARAGALPDDEHVKLLNRLRADQERALAGKPSEPFAWARLSYLRLATMNDSASAFEALHMSDWVSPWEPRQLPERALMWRQLRAAEDDDARAYQPILWQKAFTMEREDTWKLAQQHGITGEVGEALQQADDPGLYEEWKNDRPSAH